MLKIIRLWLRRNMEFVFMGIGSIGLTAAFGLFVQAVQPNAVDTGFLRWMALVCLLIGLSFYLVAGKVAWSKDREERLDRQNREKRDIERFEEEKQMWASAGISLNPSINKKPESKGEHNAAS